MVLLVTPDRMGPDRPNGHAPEDTYPMAGGIVTETTDLDLDWSFITHYGFMENIGGVFC